MHYSLSYLAYKAKYMATLVVCERAGAVMEKVTGAFGQAQWSQNAQKHQGSKKVAKALDGQRYTLTLCECMWMCDGKGGSGPKGANDLCLVSFEPQDHKLNLKAEI